MTQNLRPGKGTGQTLLDDNFPLAAGHARRFVKGGRVCVRAGRVVYIGVKSGTICVMGCSGVIPRGMTWVWITGIFNSRAVSTTLCHTTDNQLTVVSN